MEIDEEEAKEEERLRERVVKVLEMVKMGRDEKKDRDAREGAELLLSGSLLYLYLSEKEDEEDNEEDIEV